MLDNLKKTIFFDFDGVIADSFHIAFEVSRMNRPTLTLESYKDKWKTNISKAVFTEPKIEKQIDFQREYAEKMGKLELTSAKREALEELSKKFNFHIISSTNTSTIKYFLETNNIHHYFGDILGYDVAASKVEKFSTLFSRYGLDPKDVIFITDTVGDIEEARESGIGTIIAVADGYQEKEILENSHPTHVIGSILELPNLLQEK